MNKVALFDFCETLVNFQTADAFVDFVREHERERVILVKYYLKELLNRIYVIKAFEKVTKGRFSINKRLTLWQIKGFKQSEIVRYAQLYYIERIKPNFIADIINILLSLQAEGYDIYIVSGGYDVYLNFFAREFKVKGVISTKIRFKNNLCTGKIDGIDCMNRGKVRLLDDFFQRRPAYSEAYSDSITDLPFLKWANIGIVVSKDKHQIWVDKNYLKEIIWTRKE